LLPNKYFFRGSLASFSSSIGLLAICGSRSRDGEDCSLHRGDLHSIKMKSISDFHRGRRYNDAAEILNEASSSRVEILLAMSKEKCCNDGSREQDRGMIFVLSPVGRSARHSIMDNSVTYCATLRYEHDQYVVDVAILSLRDGPSLIIFHSCVAHRRTGLFSLAITAIPLAPMHSATSWRSCERSFISLSRCRFNLR